MKKRIFGTLLMGAFLVASMSTFMSCKDYDDDINDLRNLIQKNADAVAAIQNKVNDGTAVQTVAPTSDGGVTITLSNGTQYTVQPGANGKDGKDGVDGKDGKDGVDGKDGKDGVDGKDGKDGKDGTVWSIGDDGYWYLNGQKTDYNAIGKDGKDGKNGKNGVDGKNGTNGKDGKDGKDGADGADGKDGIYYVPGTEGDEAGFWVKVDPNTNPATRTITSQKWLAEGAGVVTAVYDEKAGYLYLYNVEGGTGKDKQFVITLWSHLQSLVFEPDFYFDGIEAFDFSTYKYNKMTVNPVSADVEYNYASTGGISSVKKQYNTDAPTAAAALTTVAPDLQATYHLNPANAKVSDKAADYKFLAYNKWATRSTNRDVSSVFTINKVDLGTKGKVTIHARYNADAIKGWKAAWGEVIKTGVGAKDTVTVVALQHIQKDSVVTSDYAAVMTSTWTNLELNNPKLNMHLNTTPKVTAPSTPSHLYKTAAAAIAAAATVQVAWNSTLDLRTVVNTHRSKDGGANCQQWDADATKGTVEKDGFAYSFQLVGYTKGSNFTSQSAHAAINPEDGYTFRPQLTVDGKQAPYGSEQNQACIDKEPVVRVLLTDTNNGNIAAVGYFKIQIVAAAGPGKTEKHVDIPAVTKPDYTIACGDANTTLVKLAWHDIEEQIIAELATSKATFETNYVLDGGTADANQFKEATTDATALTAANKNGVVSQTTVDVQGTQTEVLQWVLNNQRAYALFKSGKTEISTYVRYTRVAGSGPQYFYVKFTWKPGKINITPEPEFTTANKINGYWYADNDATAGSGYENIHGNVEVIGTTNDVLTIPTSNATYTPTYTSTAVADDEYVFDIRNTIVKNTLNNAAVMVAPYTTLAFTAGFPRIEFLDGHGLYAYLGANTAATRYTDANYGYELYAKRTKGTVNLGTAAAPVYAYTYTDLIASMDPLTGVVRYNDGAKAKELLNAYGHKELDKTVTAKVGVFADYCTIGAKDVKNYSFDIKFLRPVDINEGSANFEDAETLGSNSAVKFQFVDWRDHDFVDAADKNKRKGQNYFNYYGQRIGGIKIKVDVPNAETDLNGTRTKLSNITSKLLFSYIAADGTVKADATTSTAAAITASVNATTGVVTTNYGQIHYENNGVTVGTFTVWFPVEVQYDWGTIKTWIKSVVGKTQDNARKK